MLVYILATGRPTDRLCVYYDNIPGPTTSVVATQTTHVARSPDNKGAFKQKLLQLVACVARKLLSRVPLSRSDVLINTMEETAFGDHILSFIVSDRGRARASPSVSLLLFQVSAAAAFRGILRKGQGGRAKVAAL